MNGSDFYDHLETRGPDEREAQLFSKLPVFLAKLQSEYPGWRLLLAGIEPSTITSRAALAALPLLRKSSLTQLQAETPPFGGLASASPVRVFMSPGPVFEPQSPIPDAWGFARALYAAGFRAGAR